MATAAYRGEGTSLDYIPLPFPAVADIGVTQALMNACKALGHRYTSGIVYTRDAFYRRDQALNERLTEAGIVAAEQECATVFVVGSLLKVKVGAILGTDSNIWLKEQPSQEEKERLYQQAEKTTIAIALAAVDELHASKETA